VSAENVGGGATLVVAGERRQRMRVGGVAAEYSERGHGAMVLSLALAAAGKRGRAGAPASCMCSPPAPSTLRSRRSPSSACSPSALDFAQLVNLRTDSS
jgi:hypothetical protein